MYAETEARELLWMIGVLLCVCPTVISLALPSEVVSNRPIKRGAHTPRFPIQINHKATNPLPPFLFRRPLLKT